ncbi:putative Glutamate receptor ionotropic, delta-1-like 41, partial [Homarus americanus]
IYSGTLTAFLAIPSFERPVDSLIDLLHATRYDFVPGFLVGSSNEFLFKEAKTGIFRKVWEARHPTRSFSPTIDHAMDMVLKDKQVFVNARLGSVIRSMVRGRENYHLGRQTMYPQSYGVACKSGAPYKKVFERWSQAWWTQDQVNTVVKMTTAEHDTLKGPEPISLNHLQGAFLILGMGYLSAILVFLAHVILRSWCNTGD